MVPAKYQMHLSIFSPWSKQYWAGMAFILRGWQPYISIEERPEAFELMLPHGEHYNKTSLCDMRCYRGGSVAHKTILMKNIWHNIIHHLHDSGKMPEGRGLCTMSDQSSSHFILWNGTIAIDICVIAWARTTYKANAISSKKAPF